MTAAAPRAPRPFADFAFTPETEAKAAAHIAKYPQGRQASAIMPLLWLAQEQMREQTGVAWLPVPVIEYCAARIGMPWMRAYEVATFYTMYNLKPVGNFHLDVCGTTPCWLRGSDEVFRACRDFGLRKGEVTHDGLFSLAEVECLGACVNAPMLQLNAGPYFEDLDYASTTRLLEAWAAGETPAPGPQVERQLSAPIGGETTLLETSDAR